MFQAAGTACENAQRDNIIWKVNIVGMQSEEGNGVR